MEVEASSGCVAFEPGGGRVWVGTRAGVAAVFEVETGERVTTITTELDFLRQPRRLGSIAFDAEGRRVVAVTSGVGAVLAMDRVSGAPLWSHDFGGGNDSPLRVCFTVDGAGVFVWGQGGDFKTRLFDAATGEVLIDFHGSGASSLCPAPVASRHLFGLASDRLIGFDLAQRGRVRWTRVDTPGGGWVRTTAQGWVDGTPGAFRGVLVLDERGSAPLATLADQLVSPERVRRIADGEDVAAARLELR